MEVSEKHPRVADPPMVEQVAAPDRDDAVNREQIERDLGEADRQIRPGEWIDTQGLVNHLWRSYERYFRTRLLASGYRTKVVDGHTPNMSAQGNGDAHWRTSKPKPHNLEQTCLMHRAVGWLTSLARQEGQSKCWRSLQNHKDRS